MKDPNGFDQVARQKLAERYIAFDEAHWAEMEKLLAQRKRRPFGWWPWMTAGALLLAGGALWLTTPGPDPIAEAQAVPHERVEPIAPTSMPAPSTSVDVTNQAASPQVAPASRSNAEHAAIDASHNGGAPDVTRSPHRPQDASSVTHEVNQGSIAPKAEPMVQATAKAPTAADEPSALGTAMQEPVPELRPMDPANPSPTGMNPPAATVDGTDGTVGAAADTARFPSLGPIAQGGSTMIDTTAEVVSDPATDTPQPDPTAEGSIPAGQDTSSATSPPEPPTVWLARRVPMEITGMAGGHTTTAEYSGEGIGDWGAVPERGTAPGFGLEVMANVGRHFALGTGVHYASYRERLNIPERSTTDLLLSTQYFWTPIDTMVLAVVDTIQIGAVDYYVTELVATTVNVLDQTTDTTYVTTIRRSARSVVNTVSYLEVPLLLDAHTTRGRWVFGVRGGPTFGFLTGRSGTVPGMEGEGYADLQERTFRSMTLGATMRAYIRYRLSSSWSIGLEPTYRRQLSNAFGDGPVRRRAEALGAGLSLTYTITGKQAKP